MCGKVVGLRLHGVCKAPRLEGFVATQQGKDRGLSKVRCPSET